jgi:hypothetical protein
VSDIKDSPPNVGVNAAGAFDLESKTGVIARSRSTLCSSETRRNYCRVSATIQDRDDIHDVSVHQVVDRVWKPFGQRTMETVVLFMDASS